MYRTNWGQIGDAVRGSIWRQKSLDHTEYATLSLSLPARNCYHPLGRLGIDSEALNVDLSHHRTDDSHLTDPLDRVKKEKERASGPLKKLIQELKGPDGRVRAEGQQIRCA